MKHLVELPLAVRFSKPQLKTLIKNIMVEVLRLGKDYNITHIRVINGKYVTKRDYDKWLGYNITDEDVMSFFGDDNLSDVISDVANLKYNEKILRYDIMQYCGVFEDEIIEQDI